MIIEFAQDSQCYALSGYKLESELLRQYKDLIFDITYYNHKQETANLLLSVDSLINIFQR
jgi:hypothetical protein